MAYVVHQLALTRPIFCKMIPPGLEPGTLCVLGTRDNHYTTESLYFCNIIGHTCAGPVTNELITQYLVIVQMSSHSDEVAEWLRRWTANPLGSARVGSNPIFVAPAQHMVKVLWCNG